MPDEVEHVLFRKHAIFNVIEQQTSELQNSIARLSRVELEKDHSVLAEELAAKCSLKIPVLLEDQIVVTDDETQIDASPDPVRSIPDPSRPFFVSGVRITVHVPFEGDGWLFDVHPTTHSLNPPSAKVQSAEILLVKYVPPERQAALKAEINQDLENVKKCLECLAPSVRELAADLKQIAMQEISRRQQQLASQADLISSLGFPKRTGKPDH
jgi:hypothetical protein